MQFSKDVLLWCKVAKCFPYTAETSVCAKYNAQVSFCQTKSVTDNYRNNDQLQE